MENLNETVVKTEERRPSHPLPIINHVLNTANQWYEIKFPPGGVKAWSLRLRESNDMNYKYDSGSTYKTLSAGGEISQDTFPTPIKSIFVRCDTANVTVELEVWQ